MTDGISAAYSRRCAGKTFRTYEKLIDNALADLSGPEFYPVNLHFSDFSLVQSGLKDRLR